jgi:hypothetical protein
LSLALIESGTMAIPILTFGATNATRDGSSLTGDIVNSMGSSWLLLSPHCSASLPAHIRIPSTFCISRRKLPQSHRIAFGPDFNTFHESPSQEIVAIRFRSVGGTLSTL